MVNQSEAESGRILTFGGYILASTAALDSSPDYFWGEKYKAKTIGSLRSFVLSLWLYFSKQSR